MDAALHHHSHKVMLHLLKALPVNQQQIVDEQDDAPPPYEVGSYIAPPGSKYIASPEDDEDDEDEDEDDDVDEDMFSDAGSCYSEDDAEMYLDEDDQDDKFLHRNESNNIIPCDGDTPTGKEPAYDPPAYSSRPASPARSNNSAPPQQQANEARPNEPQPASVPPSRQQATDSAFTRRPPQHVIEINATTRIRGTNNKVTADFAYLGAKLADRILSHLTSISPAPNEPRANFSVAIALGSEGGRSRGGRASSAIVKTPTIHLTVNCGLEIQGDGNIVVGGQAVQQAQTQAPGGPRQARDATTTAQTTRRPQHPREDTTAQAARDRLGQLLAAIQVPPSKAASVIVEGEPNNGQDARAHAQIQEMPVEGQAEQSRGVQQQGLAEGGFERLPKREREDTEEDRVEEDAKRARL